MKVVQYLMCSLFALMVFGVKAQSPDLLRAEGEIPREFITPSTVKYKKQIEGLEEDNSRRKERKKKDRFYLESNFAIDDILQSGMVLFNDPATQYVNKVLAQLPINDRKLKNKEPRVYVLNSSAVNAFATQQGIIFVTLGLLANVENEAQLAFILSHELMHVKYQHSINKFLYANDIDENKKEQDKNVDKIAVDRNVFKKSMYSRQLEEEADQKGLEVFLQSDYDPQAVLNTFKVLHYSYLPFRNDPFEKSFFEDNAYIFPAELWLEEVNEISEMEADQEEEESATHPSSVERLNKLRTSLAALPEGTLKKKAFILPEADFEQVQKLARYQLPFLNLYAENFPEAIYTSYLLLKNYPGDLELQKVIGKALYMEAKYRNFEPENVLNHKIHRKEITKGIEGAAQRVYHLLTEMNNRELTVLAMKYNWELYEQNQEDQDLKILLDDLFIEFATEFPKLEAFGTSVEPDTSNSTKADRTFWKSAFAKSLDTDLFKQHYEAGQKEVEDREKRKEFYTSDEGRKELSRRGKKERKNGKQLGITKVVVVNPFYLSVDGRKEDQVQFLRTEERQVYFRQSIKELAKTSKVNATILDITDLSVNDIDRFNDIAEINHYFSQQMNHYDLSLTPAYNQVVANEIAEKYGTEYFLWTGVISLHKKNNGWGLVAFSLLVPYALPLTLANALSPRFDMLYYAILFDVKTGRRSILKMDYFNKRDSKTVLKAHIYDVFNQIRSKG